MKILSLDGGGVFGKTQTRILSLANCFDKFDCFTGTSIGSGLAACIALGLYYKVDPSFFDTWMPLVFHRCWMRRFVPFVSKYPDKGLNAALQSMFGSARMGDVKKPLFITAADIGRRTLKVFDSTNFDDSRMSMWEVVRTATAAETYFNPWKGMADGSVFANNPSMVGIAAAARVLKTPIEELEILSIGTGRSTKEGQGEPKSLIQWGGWLVGSLLDGASDDMHDYFARSMPIKKCVRIQFLRDCDWRMDNPADMAKAEAKWAADVQKAIGIVKAF